MKAYTISQICDSKKIRNVKMSDLPQYGKHHALYDCYRQIIGFQRSEKNLKKIK